MSETQSDNQSGDGKKNWINVAALEDLADLEAGQCAALELELDNGSTRSVLLIKQAENTWYAMDNICTHDGGCLDDGDIDLNKNTIECARHGAHFNIQTGEALSMPAVHPVATYPLKVESGQLFLQI